MYFKYILRNRGLDWIETIKDHSLMPIKEVINFDPYDADDQEVEVWYKTTASLTSYLIKNGGSFNFSVFLKELRDGKSAEAALARAYPGKYSNFEQLYEIWKGSNGL